MSRVGDVTPVVRDHEHRNAALSYKIEHKIAQGGWVDSWMSRFMGFVLLISRRAGNS